MLVSFAFSSLSMLYWLLGQQYSWRQVCWCIISFSIVLGYLSQKCSLYSYLCWHVTDSIHFTLQTIMANNHGDILRSYLINDTFSFSFWPASLGLHNTDGCCIHPLHNSGLFLLVNLLSELDSKEFIFTCPVRKRIVSHVLLWTIQWHKEIKIKNY